MKVSTSKSFTIVYSLFQHEYLGYLFESYVIQLDDKNRLTFLHQNISSKNASEFEEALDHHDYELIRLMDAMQQDRVIQKFYNRKIKPREFFLKIYDKKKGNKNVQQEISNYLEIKRSKILALLKGKNLYEMGNDGEPAWREIEVVEEKASVLFHFRRNTDNTHYFPTIKCGGEKIEFQYKNAIIICDSPAWMLVNGKLLSFQKNVDGKKLRPFLNKKFIMIPKQVEETYYRKFVAPLIASYDVYAKGFEIKSDHFPLSPKLTFSQLAHTKTNRNGSSNGNGSATSHTELDADRLMFELSFTYGPYNYRADKLRPVSVNLEQNDNDYIFHRVNRNQRREKEYLELLANLGMPLKHGFTTKDKQEAFSWLQEHKQQLESMGFTIRQTQLDNKRYFLGESSISIDVRENIDWFDIHTIVRFGEYEIPFLQLRKVILAKKNEVPLPNGEIGVIPEHWLREYSELFAFMEQKEQSDEMKLKKHHLALVQELGKADLAEVSMSKKLEGLKKFEQIEDSPLPKAFKGDLRPYQKAGYNWLLFLNKFRFGGCLADDMGLGKTVQTLAILQCQKEMGHIGASLLVMPTSLIYNWQMEARKFTPNLKVFIYTGTNRIKDVAQFDGYDLVLTSYGITRLDIETLKNYCFNYIILDESQAIKNPSSHIAKAVKQLNSRFRLILTGTPLENSTLDLWSQMTFINPGLLGNQSYFKSEFQNPIEKKQDDEKTQKLNTIIKPFILRRNKSQVATELPEKIENIQYCTMTTMQEDHYEASKSYYRNKILKSIESHGVNKSQFLLLQGLTRLRQIANHPKLVDPDYVGDSGKLEDVTHMLNNAISKGHKILVFSQFVKHLSLLKTYLLNNHIPFSYLDGATKDRQQQVEKFQTQDHVRVFLISLKAGGLGLNLTKADYVFLLDPWWNPAIEAQATDRAHRIGQENKVFTYKFITKSTVEEKILALQKNKIKLAQNLITVDEGFVKTLSKDDIESLLQ
jgi:SNF2 family DNA or RNA helicase